MVRTFKALKDKKLGDEAFKAFFEENCTVCAFTMKIFAELHGRGIPLSEPAEALGIHEVELRDLMEGESCDPDRVVSLCRYLNLPEPKDCPRKKG